MNIRLLYFFAIFLIGSNGFSQQSEKRLPSDNNPIFEGWYADPEAMVFDDTYWVYPTFSDDYDKQLHFDAFSSKDLVHWQKHERILDTTKVKWLRQALWAPSIIEKEDKSYVGLTVFKILFNFGLAIIYPILKPAIPNDFDKDFKTIRFSNFLTT